MMFVLPASLRVSPLPPLGKNGIRPVLSGKYIPAMPFKKLLSFLFDFLCLNDLV